MNLTATLKVLRARKNASAKIAAFQILPKGLKVEAKLEGKWLLSRVDVKPESREVEIVARDAGMVNGFTLRTGPGKESGDTRVYSLITPLQDDPDEATVKPCPKCEKRSLMKDGHSSLYCPECGHSTAGKLEPLHFEPEPPMPAPESPALPPASDDPVTSLALETAEFEALDTEPVQSRRDARPGSPLLRPRGMKPSTLYHFQAYGVLWTVKLEPKRDGHDLVCWAAQERLEGNQGYCEGSLAQFEAWFKQYGALSPLEPPAYWRCETVEVEHEPEALA